MQSDENVMTGIYNAVSETDITFQDMDQRQYDL